MSVQCALAVNGLEACTVDSSAALGMAGRGHGWGTYGRGLAWGGRPRWSMFSAVAKGPTLPKVMPNCMAPPVVGQWDGREYSVWRRWGGGGASGGEILDVASTLLYDVGFNSIESMKPWVMRVLSSASRHKSEWGRSRWNNLTNTPSVLAAVTAGMKSLSPANSTAS